jgi:deazaflavin-dependent oxidoreductase (nitroreductase family)
MDDIGEQLAGWGKVLRLETRGRVTGRPTEVAIGYVEDPDRSFLVAAGNADADWARNLDADPGCRILVGESPWRQALAEPLEGADAQRAVRELILKYGTPAERLGHGPAYRLRFSG